MRSFPSFFFLPSLQNSLCIYTQQHISVQLCSVVYVLVAAVSESRSESATKRTYIMWEI